MISADLERQIMNRLVAVSTTIDFELQNLFEFEPSTVVLLSDLTQMVR